MQKGIVIWFFLSLSLFLKAEDTSAYGWKVPHTPFYLGGYVSLNYDEDEVAKEKFVFDDIALLLYGKMGKFDILGEFEASDIPLKRQKLKIYCERLRLAYYLHDDTVIHLGKFNSSVGFWNQSPINVLEDTTTSPQLLKNIFPKRTSGLAIYQSFDEGDKELSFTLQHNTDLDDAYNNIMIDRHIGLGYKSDEERFVWRANVGYFRKRQKQEYYYLGFGYQQELDAWMLMAEAFTKQGEQGDDVPYDIYMQATWSFVNHHDIVFRSEFYKDKNIGLQENISLLGYTYRPISSIAIKGEYIKHSKLPKSRFVASFSWIF